MVGRRWSFGVFIGALVVTHFLLHLSLGIGSAAPDLLTVAALLAARRLRGGAAAAVGCVLGVLQDALALSGFGAGAVALTVVSYLGARSRDLFEGESSGFILLYLLLGTWLYRALVFGLTLHLASTGAVSTLLLGGIGQAVYAALAGLVCLAIFRAAGGEA